MGCLTQTHTDTHTHTHTHTHCQEWTHAVWLSRHHLFFHTRTITTCKKKKSPQRHNHPWFSLIGDTIRGWCWHPPRRTHQWLCSHTRTLVSGRSALGVRWLFMSVDDKRGFYHLADKRVSLSLSLTHTHTHEKRVLCLGYADVFLTQILPEVGPAIWDLVLL